jgi:hypothetical protein
MDRPGLRLPHLLARVRVRVRVRRRRRQAEVAGASPLASCPFAVRKLTGEAAEHLRLDTLPSPFILLSSRHVSHLRDGTVFDFVGAVCVLIAPPPPAEVGTGYTVRVRVKIMGPGKYENVGKSQSVLMMIDPIISTRTRITTRDRLALLFEANRPWPCAQPSSTRHPVGRARSLMRAGSVGWTHRRGC